MASPSVPSSISVAEDPKLKLGKKIRSHEVAVDELNNLSTSRVVYQKSGNIFFRTSIRAAAAAEQRQVDLAKAQLQKLNSA
ncbi:prefoldin chaperone subunit family protein [Tasmannia lanceolata]|uniref:prefoldin chaperone subunit family protein n=1 Tax=Tasmannia lanceolata TaxID=3420 RepID=UPI004063822B